MSGPKPPGREPEELDSERELDDELNSGSAPVPELDSLDALDHSGDLAAIDQTGATDAYSRAYSAPESEHFTSARMCRPELYDYDNYDEPGHDERGAPRWPWVVGVAAILAAVALVVSVSLLVIHSGNTSNVANPSTSASTPPVQDEITTTTPPSPSPPPPSTEPPTATETQTVTVTPSPSPTPVPPPVTTAAPPPATSTAAAPPRRPRRWPVLGRSPIR